MAEQKLLLGNVRGPQGPAGPNEVSASTTTSGFENGHVLVNNNGKVGGKKLTASDVGARPDSWTHSAEEVGAVRKASVATLASGISWKSGSINTPEGWDNYAIIRISSNYGSAFIKRLIANEQSAGIVFSSSTGSGGLNIAVAQIKRSSGGASLSFSAPSYVLKLAPGGITENQTELNIYKIEGYA